MMNKNIENPQILAFVGPTGIGKTAIAMELAHEWHIPIISCDSMQIYHYMDIGTAKPTAEEQQVVPHLMIDCADPDEHYDACRYRQETLDIIQSLSGELKNPFVVGGTGFYLKALLEGLFEEVKIPLDFRQTLMDKYQSWDNLLLHEQLIKTDPETAQRLHPNDRKRVLRALEVYEFTGNPLSWYHQQHKQRQSTVESLVIGLRMPMPDLYKQIGCRVERMMAQGWVDEVIFLREKGYSPSLNSMQGLGYRQINDYLEGRLDYSQLPEIITQVTCQYAKRQMTWFRGNPHLIWYDRDHPHLLSEIKEKGRIFWKL